MDAVTTVVCGNPRLARELKLAKAGFETHKGRASWLTPDILPFSAWIGRVWQEYQEHSSQSLPGLLTPLQEAAVWEASIVDDLNRRGAATLLNVPGAAIQARRANAILDDWGQGAPDHEAVGLWVGEDAMAFREWRKRLQRRCREQGWITTSAVTAVLTGCIDEVVRGLPNRIVFAGFFTLTPEQQRLVDALLRAGIEVTIEPLPVGRALGQRLSFADAGAELETVARWARGLLEGGIASVGVVVPDLLENRAYVERKFDEVLDSSHEYELSVTPSLARVPVIRDALLVLRLLRDTVSIAELEQVLRSPFLGKAEDELHTRGILVGELRQRGKPEVSLESLARHSRAVTGLDGLLDAALALRAAWPPLQSLARWTVAMSSALTALGWPGDGLRGQAQTRAVEQFQDVLTDLAGLGMIIGSVDINFALSKLERLCAERNVTVSSHRAPIQVMTIDESLGLEFERLWVTGLHDGVWPRSSRPNPFLPGGWQQRHDVPGSSPEHELNFATRVTSMWMAAADDVMFSHPLQQADLGLRASPVLRGLEECDEPPSKSKVATPRQRLQLARPVLESLRDFTAPPVGNDDTIRGGTSVFKNQAACPFRGFAIHRLGAATLDATRVGLDALDRGSLVHDVLALVWNRLGGHAELVGCSTTALEALVSDCVDETFAGWERRRPGLLEGRFADLEHQRLVALINQWLALEKDRAPFVVDASERETYAEVGNIPIRIRPDRIDRLEDGTLFIIDYKTGDVSRNSWFGERIDEPQLPLYCTAIDAAEGRVAGVTFASVKIGKIGFAGIADRDGLAPGITGAHELPDAKTQSPLPPGSDWPGSDWPGLKRAWRESLNGVAREFLHGHAAVSPKSANSCRYCQIWALCRIRELSMLEPLEEEEL